MTSVIGIGPFEGGAFEEDDAPLAPPALRLVPDDALLVDRRLPDDVRWKAGVKRATDVVVAAVLLVLTLPVVVVAALAIKLQDGGPVLFRQTRVGKDGRRFVLAKLRSMVPDAEHHLPALAARNHREGPLFKLTNDPRVTRIGRFLRATSIDELPQLVAVLRGTMSMVGPRPALPEEVAQFDEALLGRLRVLPGITGLWQVQARDDPSFETYRRLDLAYLERRSLRLDLAIMATTAAVVLRRGVRALKADPAAVEPAVVLD